jgi:mRNA interferase RelE/StbE
MFTLSLTRDCCAFIKGLDSKPARQVYERILGLCEDPKPQNAKPLVAHKGLWRMRVGDFRVIYSIEDNRVNIVIVDRRNDDEVYKRIERLSA